MAWKKSARRCGNSERAMSTHEKDVNIIADYDRATLIGGLIIAISFGAMIFIGVILGW